MASKHYGYQVWVVHVWGKRSWQHQWAVYGSEVQAKVQATRMAETYWVEHGEKTASYEIIRVTGTEN